MIRLALASALVWISAYPAQANVVEVRSGRHDGYTRLIVDMTERVKFKIENSAKEAVVTFAAPDLAFDFSPVFQRIGRDRIADIVTGEDPGSFRIKLNCTCDVSSFWHEKALLVLDVREVEQAALELPEEIQEPKPNDPPAVRPKLVLSSEADEIAKSLMLHHLPLASPSANPNDANDQVQDLSEPEPNSELVAKARERLLQQLGRAATQGLLSPRRLARLTDQTRISPEPGEPTLNSGEADEGIEAPEIRANVNLRALSSIDRDFLNTVPPAIAAELSSVCLGDELFDIGRWGTESPFSKQVGKLRVSLLEEFDYPDTEAVVELAQLYLYFGFGEEARQTLSLITETDQELEILRILAAIMEDGFASKAGILATQLGCPGFVSLWSALAYQSLPSELSTTDNALKAFSALPGHLRSYLGPILSRRYLEAGHKEAADTVLRTLKRSEETETSGAQLVEAEIHRRDGENAHALEKLELVVSTNSEPSADAIISLIDTLLQSDQDVPFDQAVLAGSYLQQNRGGPLEQELARVYLTGLSASGAYEQAYRELSRLSDELQPSSKNRVNSDLLHQLTRKAGDIEFLRYVSAFHLGNTGDVPPKLANETAKRLIDIGFANQARPFVAPETTGSASRERQLLRAQIWLAAKQPHRAEAAVANLQGDDADFLRARARDEGGDFRTASAFYASAGKQEEAEHRAWLGEDWNALLKSENPVISGAAALATVDDEGGADAGEHDLSHNLALVQQSITARNVLDELLTAFPYPDGL